MFTGIKIFSATKQKERETLGEAATAWLTAMQGSIEIVDKTVTQSSDHAYHCFTITLFYRHTSPQGQGTPHE